MGPNGPGSNNWARTAQGPTIGPERPRVQQMAPNGPGSNNWARTAQGPTNGPERPRVQQMGPNGPGSNNWARTAQGPTIGPERPRVQQLVQDFWWPGLPKPGHQARALLPGRISSCQARAAHQGTYFEVHQGISCVTRVDSTQGEKLLLRAPYQPSFESCSDHSETSLLLQFAIIGVLSVISSSLCMTMMTPQ